MTAIPDIHYALSGDVAIAYQVLGDGPIDVVFVPFFGNIRGSGSSRSTPAFSSGSRRSRG